MSSEVSGAATPLRMSSEISLAWVALSTTAVPDSRASAACASAADPWRSPTVPGQHLDAVRDRQRLDPEQGAQVLGRALGLRLP